MGKKPQLGGGRHTAPPPPMYLRVNKTFFVFAFCLRFEIGSILTGSDPKKEQIESELKKTSLRDRVKQTALLSKSL